MDESVYTATPRQVVMDNARNTRNVDSSCRHIGGHENALRSGFLERLECLKSLFLGREMRRGRMLLPMLVFEHEQKSLKLELVPVLAQRAKRRQYKNALGRIVLRCGSEIVHTV